MANDFSIVVGLKNVQNAHRLIFEATITGLKGYF